MSHRCCSPTPCRMFIKVVTIGDGEGEMNVITRVDGTHLEGLIYRQKLAIVVGKGEGSEPA